MNKRKFVILLGAMVTMAAMLFGYYTETYAYVYVGRTITSYRSWEGFRVEHYAGSPSLSYRVEIELVDIGEIEINGGQVYREYSAVREVSVWDYRTDVLKSLGVYVENLGLTLYVYDGEDRSGWTWDKGWFTPAPWY